MPMPPPKPSTEGPRDRQVLHEMGQIARAVESRGPQAVTDLTDLVGGEFWEEGRFERALRLAVADGLVHRTGEGLIAPAG